jgi:cytosine/adenosine deaminase-related metal-dependent hydrolase
MQTHLNEQRREKQRVEQVLYPDAASYTDVYRRDDLLDREAILAHCIHMRPDEFAMVGDAGAVIAHCPTSNTLLGSGIMNLDEVSARGIDYAICTDVGASPTTSILAEMAQFLKIHHGRSTQATAREALFRSTLAPARMLGLNDLGTFEVGKPLSYVEVDCDMPSLRTDSADEMILASLLNTSSSQRDAFASREKRSIDALQSSGLEIGPELQSLSDDVAATRQHLDNKVLRVVMNGAVVWERD